MPPVNWDAFESLPGGVQSNFEKLCRALIRRHYGRYGNFAALAAQPGVEFHLKLHTLCGALGDPGQWYGWQCRWYDLLPGRPIGTTRRRKIKEAITITERVLPDLTDWVLWTRRTLTRSDQEWFEGLGQETHMRLHLWDANEVEEHLSGDADILRGTYFGELVLTPDTLANLHERAVAPIRRRWKPEVHQTIEAERILRRMLGETDTWGDLRALADQLRTDSAAVNTDRGGLSGPLDNAVSEVAGLADTVAAALTDAYAALAQGNIDLLQQQSAALPVRPDPRLATLPRQLRAGRHRAALTVTNALANARLAYGLLHQVYINLGTGLVAVLADAGCGKTQLAAQLTMAVGDRPAGILLYGRGLQAGHSFDDLARSVVIHGSPVPSMESLVAAVDAAGQRAHRRLPIVIDGLNEAEDPRNWRGQLASLDEMLLCYPYVLIVCTLRQAFTDEALPLDVKRLEAPDFGHDAEEAIRRYFKYYRINPADAELPWRLLSHPLTLCLFCEVTNPKRERDVGIEAMPMSLTALFDRYLEQAAERIAELAPCTRRYYEQDVRAALDEIGIALWEENTHSLELSALRLRLGDEGRPWNESLVRALEQDGVLLRVPGNTPTTTRVVAMYDVLAGHLVADAVLARYGRTRLEEWLRNQTTVTALAGPLPDRHPLATDTFRALIGLVPRRLHQQLWSLLEEPLRTSALLRAADLEGTYLDAQTVEELKTLVTQPAAGSRDLLDRLWQTRGAPTHPLNADFLSAVLRPMAISERDLRWTEWVRNRQENVLVDLRDLEEQWRGKAERSPADRLRARWVMWTLTSTVRQLRDQATLTLYWFGRGDPDALFNLTLDSFAINDPYVSERLYAASYGVVMAHQLPNPGFDDALAAYLVGLRDALTGPTATQPTNHWLARLYVQGTVTLAQTYYGAVVPEGLVVEGHVPFVPGLTVEPIVSEDPRATEVNRAIHMDFENYTLGRLFDDRRNYDSSHSGHQAAIAHVRGTIWALGWRENGLGAIDKHLTSYSRGDRAKPERYGKKYGWIGFYTYAGILADKGRLPLEERLSDVDIDPSFPEPPPTAPFELPVWAHSTPADDRRWIRKGAIIVPDNLLYCPNLGSQEGPWIAVHAHLNTEDQTPGRSVFGILMALLVDAAYADQLIDTLSTRVHPGRWFHAVEVPSDYYTFAGEIPWSPEFARSGEDGNSVQLYRGTVRMGDTSPIEIEALAHRYSWESYHSLLNQAGGTLVPSQPFSLLYDLRGIPQSFGQTLPDGATVAISLGAPAGFSGNLLYLREDLVYRYAAGRRLIWFIWGERQLYPYPHPAPNWLIDIQEKGDDVWMHIRRGEELSGAFASDVSFRSGRLT